MKGWKKRWFSLKDKKLTYFKKEEIASIDMKSITNIKPPEQGSFESMCSFQILTPDRYIVIIVHMYMYMYLCVVYWDTLGNITDKHVDVVLNMNTM